MTGYDSIGEELEDIHELFEDFGANANKKQAGLACSSKKYGW